MIMRSSAASRNAQTAAAFNDRRPSLGVGQPVPAATAPWA